MPVDRPHGHAAGGHVEVDRREAVRGRVDQLVARLQEGVEGERAGGLRRHQERHLEPDGVLWRRQAEGLLVRVREKNIRVDIFLDFL